MKYILDYIICRFDWICEKCGTRNYDSRKNV